MLFCLHTLDDCLITRAELRGYNYSTAHLASLTKIVPSGLL